MEKSISIFFWGDFMSTRGIKYDDFGNVLLTQTGQPRVNKPYNMPKFKKRAGVALSERKQGLIFYMCKNFAACFNDDEKRRFVALCERCSKGNTEALFTYLVSEEPVTVICNEYGVSRSRLYDYTDTFYNNFQYVKDI